MTATSDQSQAASSSSEKDTSQERESAQSSLAAERDTTTRELREELSAQVARNRDLAEKLQALKHRLYDNEANLAGIGYLLDHQRAKLDRVRAKKRGSMPKLSA